MSDDERYDGPTAAQLEAAAYVSPMLRRMKKEVADRRVTVVNQETGKVVGKMKWGDVVHQVAAAFSLETQKDPDKRPDVVTCRFCGVPIRIGNKGPLPEICSSGCKCDCGKNLHRSSVRKAASRGKRAKCKQCRQGNKTPRRTGTRRPAKTPEQRSALCRAREAAKTPEQRSEAMRKAWITRRSNSA